MKKNSPILCGEERQWKPVSSQHGCNDREDNSHYLCLCPELTVSDSDTIVRLFGYRSLCFRKEELECRVWELLSWGHRWTCETIWATVHPALVMPPVQWQMFPGGPGNTRWHAITPCQGQGEPQSHPAHAPSFPWGEHKQTFYIAFPIHSEATGDHPFAEHCRMFRWKMVVENPGRASGRFHCPAKRGPHLWHCTGHHLYQAALVEFLELGWRVE